MPYAQLMSELTASLEARRARIHFVFDAYNDRNFDAMLANYAEDIAFTSPVLKEGESASSASGIGKAAIRERLHLFHEKFGRLTILDVFAVDDQVSVVVRSEDGQRFSFSIETEAGQVRRLFVFPTT